MNTVCLVGRLTRDPDVRYTNEGTSIARFSIAVDRKFKSRDGNGPDADFPSIVAFGRTGEFIEKYFTKGMKIGIVGRLQTGSYQKEDGTKVYTTDVIAENVEFVESKAAQNEENSQNANNEFSPVPDDEELPFN